jgi:putative ubiquitin-RnfH superfamily antitoxin RatB of RatAB toxin-antitoxin module
MRIEVVRALPGSFKAVSLELPAGATLRDALAAAGIRLQEREACGVFGERASLERVLAEGDRVEVYRPLEVDPKEARRRRAAKKPLRR